MVITHGWHLIGSRPHTLRVEGITRLSMECGYVEGIANARESS